jgi:hypothetical protein
MRSKMLLVVALLLAIALFPSGCGQVNGCPLCGTTKNDAVTIGCKRANVAPSRTHGSPGLSGERPGDENREEQDPQAQAQKQLSPHRNRSLEPDRPRLRHGSEKRMTRTGRKAAAQEKGFRTAC